MEGKKVKITVARGGPLRVSDLEGLVEIVWSDGEVVTPPSEKAFAFCRCGQSENMPFCNGAHKACGFAESLK